MFFSLRHRISKAGPSQEAVVKAWKKRGKNTKCITAGGEKTITCVPPCLMSVGHQITPTLFFILDFSGEVDSSITIFRFGRYGTAQRLVDVGRRMDPVDSAKGLDVTVRVRL